MRSNPNRQLQVWKWRPERQETGIVSALSRPFQALMSIFNQRQVVKAAPSLRPVVVDPDSFLAYILLQDDSRLSPTDAMYYYRMNSAVATSVDWIAESFEQISPVLQSADGSIDDDAEIIELLLNPNGFQTWHEFAGDLSRHYLLTHNAFLVGIGNVRFAPINIFVVKPQNVSPTSGPEDSYPAIYNLQEGAGRGTYTREEQNREIRFYSGPLKEIFQIAGFSSQADNLWGDSPLKAAALEARQQLEGRIHNLQMLENGGRLSLIVSFKDQDVIDDDEHWQRKRRIEEDLGGPGNKGKIAVISGSEVDIREVGTSNKDMDYAELDRVASNAIYMRYKIPLPLVTSQAATYNNMRTAIEMLYDFAVLPLADRLFAGVSKFLLPRFKLDPKQYRITYNPDTITALMQRKLDQLKMRKDMGLETINELRTMVPNREPIDGGDMLYQPASLIPVGTDIMEAGDIPQREGRVDEDEESDEE